MVTKSVLVCVVFLVSMVWSGPAPDLYLKECDCVNGELDSACIPWGHIVELLGFYEADGYADYAVCSVYPGGGGKHAISHFNFDWVPNPVCVPTASADDWEMKGCKTQYDYADRFSPGFTYDTCPGTIANCPKITKDNSCGLDPVNMMKCDFGVGEGQCVTVRVWFPVGMVEGPYGTFIKSSTLCAQGCSLGPACEVCPPPPPPPVYDDLDNECSEFNDGLLPYCYGLDVTSANSDCGVDYATREAKRNAHHIDAFQTKKSRQLRNTVSHQSVVFSSEEFQSMDYFNPQYRSGRFQNGLGKTINIPLTNGAARADCPDTTTSIRLRLDGLSAGQEIWVAGDSGSENGWHGSLKGPFKSEKIITSRGYVPTVPGSGAVVVVEGPGSENAFVTGILCSFDSPRDTKRVHNIPKDVVSSPQHDQNKKESPAGAASKKSEAREEEVVHTGVADGWNVEGFGSGTWEEKDFPPHGSKRGYTPDTDCFCQSGLDDAICTDFCQDTHDGCTVNMECVRDDMITFPRRVPEGAVAHISVPIDGNPFICSGGLIGQTFNYPPGKSCVDNYADYCPDGYYNNMESTRFLTAGECVPNQEAAEATEFIFNYSISCEQGITGDCYSSSPSDSYKYPNVSYNHECSVHSYGADLLVSSKDDQFKFIRDDSPFKSIWENGYGDFSLLSLTGDLPPSRCYFGYSTLNYAEKTGEVVHRVSHPEGAPRAYADSECSESSAWVGGPLTTNDANSDGDFIASLQINLTMIGRSALGTQGGSNGGIVFNDFAQVVGTQSGYQYDYGGVQQPNDGYDLDLIGPSYLSMTFDPCLSNYISEDTTEVGGYDYSEYNQFVVVDGSFYSYWTSVEDELQEICCPPLLGDPANGIVATNKLDFSIETDGTPILPPGGSQSGLLVPPDYWSEWGVTVYTQYPGKSATWASSHPPQLFNSSNPCCGDFDLGAPNAEFGGPGHGPGGESGMGANTRRQGWVMIISEGNDQEKPDDDAKGGAIVFLFDDPVPIAFIEIIDVDFNEVNGFLQATDVDDVVYELPLVAYGDNAYYRADFYVQNIVNLTVWFPGSGSISGIHFCDVNSPRLNSLGDRVWFDQNGNGIQDAYETIGVEGVKVQLHDPDRGTTNSDRLAETYTDADGYYLFSSLTDGDYVVSFYVDNDLDFFDPYKASSSWNGWSWSPLDAGSNDAVDSDAIVESSNRAITQTISLYGGVADMTWDAGIVVDADNVCIPETRRRNQKLKKRSAPHKVEASPTKRSGSYTPKRKSKLSKWSKK